MIPKLIIVTEIIAPYRIPVFNALAARREINLHVMFLAENDAAMTKMMNGMTAMPSGDIDRDFVAMMVPHHQGAIDMAKAELRYGKSEQLRRIALRGSPLQIPS